MPLAALVLSEGICGRVVLLAVVEGFGEVSWPIFLDSFKVGVGMGAAF
jgi:hypothetical protein